jgi:hypothetical protein
MRNRLCELTVALLLAMNLSSFSASAHAQQSTTTSAAGLEASVEFIGRDRSGSRLTVNLRIANKSANTVSVLLVGYPLAIDNGGTGYHLDRIGGVMTCSHDVEMCSGRSALGYVDIDSYTQIDAGTVATVNMTFESDKQGTTEGKGPLASVSAILLYRVIRDQAEDERLPDEARRRALRTMNLSIRNHPITQSK